MLSEFGKVFEMKVWRVQVAHLHNAARALSSPSWCFQMSTSLNKDFFRYLWYCGKKQIECGLALSVLLSTTIRVFTAAKMCCETVLREFKIVVLIYSCIGRHKQNVHGNLNGFSVTFSIIFTSYLWRVSFWTLWCVWYSSEWHFLSFN